MVDEKKAIEICSARADHSRDVLKGTEKIKSYWSPVEKKIRNEWILDLICNRGMSKSRAVKYIADATGVHTTCAYKWTNDALNELVATYDDDIDRLRAQQLERLQGILTTAIETNDKKAALSALDQMAKINGLYSEKKEVELKGEGTIFSFEFN